MTTFKLNATASLAEVPERGRRRIKRGEGPPSPSINSWKPTSPSAFPVFDFVASTLSYAQNPSFGTFEDFVHAPAFVLRVGKSHEFCCFGCASPSESDGLGGWWGGA